MTLRGGLPAHHVLDHADDDHDDDPANPAACDVAKYRAHAAGGCRRSSAHHRVENLAADSAADDAGNRIAECTEAVLLEQRAADVASYRAGNELHDQAYDVHACIPLAICGWRCYASRRLWVATGLC